jgi:hypothetical protein
MAVKSIIAVEIDDHQFTRFRDVFDSWSDKVDEMPEHWRALNEIMGEGFLALGESLEHISAHLATIAQHSGAVTRSLSDAERAQNSFGAATVRAGSAMKGLAGEAKSALGSVLQLGRLLGFGGALAGIGSGLGIFALAQSATSQSRTAGGVGLTPGQLNAFNTNLSPFIASPGGMLSAVSGAQIDMGQWGKLLSAGVTAQQIHSEDPAQLSIDILNNARREIRRSGNINGPAAQAALGLGLSSSDLRNVASANGKELAGYERHALTDANRLGFDAQTASDWRKLDTVLHQAGIQIESVLIKGLAPLAGPLVHLSNALVHGIGEVLASKGFREGINDAANGIEHLGKYLGSDAFGKDLQGFESGLSTLAENAKLAAIALGVLAGISAADKLRKLAGVVTTPAAAVGADAAASLMGAGLLGAGGAALAAGAIAFWPSQLGNDELGASGDALKKRRDAIGVLSTEYRNAGLPDSSVSALLGNSMWESGLDPHKRQAGGGPGYGLNQWEGPRQADFAKQFGHPMQNATLAEEGAFTIWELRNKYPDVWAQLKSGKLDLQQATRLVDHDYLAPKDRDNPTGSIIHRTAMAQQFGALLGTNPGARPVGMGASDRTAGAHPLARPSGMDMSDRTAGSSHSFNPSDRNELTGLLRQIAKNTSPSVNKTNVHINNDTPSRVYVQANAAGR